MNQNISSAVQMPERRPMFTRNWDISKHLTHWLVKRKVSPNAISIVGMAGAIVAGSALVATSLPGWAPVMFLVAVAGILTRGVSNLLDGMVAVESRQASPLGELFNEVPDRVSDIAILIGAGCATGGNPTLGLLAALVAVLVAYIRAEGKVVGAAQHYCGPMAKPGRMVVILVIALYCALTPPEWQPLFRVWNVAFGLMAIGLAVILVGGIFTFMRRLRRIMKETGTSYALEK